MADIPPVPNTTTEFAYAWTGPEVDHLNNPELNSPQPCEHGAGCGYYGSCRFVHPGEEGTGRTVFEERVVTNDDGSTFTQPACVRLIGGAGFYRRRRAQMSWPEFCARNGIPYTPNPRRQREEDNTNEEGDETPSTPAPARPQRGRGRGGYAPRGRGQQGDFSGGAGSGRAGTWQPRGGGGARGAPRGGGAPRGRGAPRQWVGLANP